MYWRSSNANWDLEAKSVCSVRFHSFELEPIRARLRKMSDEEFAGHFACGLFAPFYSVNTRSLCV
jgi:hypothetical protein